WVSHFESNPKVFVVHGEATASEALAEKIQERLGLIAHIPRWKERIILKPREVVTEKPPAEEETTDMKTPMLNTIIDLENELKALRKRVKSAEVDTDDGEEELDRLKYIQEELKSVFGS
ncbi:MAG: MBL fold metallo-hydrolase, partial [Deltaproteobacteria bacterium]|nr:MBL fold metallo-hydrolase [Deltaproteobacteria bacterium]